MTGGEEGSYGIVPGEDPPDRPRVVDEADEVLTTYTWQLLGTGGVVAAIWVGVGFFGGAAGAGFFGVTFSMHRTRVSGRARMRAASPSLSSQTWVPVALSVTLRPSSRTSG